MGLSDIKSIDIVSFLQKIGFTPTRINSHYALFHVPYRHDNHPSLRVNRRNNNWLDYGTGKNGDIVDLCKLIYNIDNTDVIVNILEECDVPISMPSRYLIDVEGNATLVSNVQIRELTNKKLLGYLDSRGVDLSLAVKFCRQINYTVKWKKYYALAFKNASGGFEIRNQYLSGYIAPRDISIISMCPSNLYCMVFENFMDFLSYITLNLRIDFSNFSSTVDYIILNSSLNLNRAIAITKKYEIVACCLPNDESGRDAVNIFAAEHDGVHDLSGVYEGYRDLNDFIRQRPIIVP